MKCNANGRYEPKEDKAFINKLLKEYFEKKTAEYKVYDYIRQNSWDEDDYNEKVKKYKETGVLPDELY